MIAPAKPSLEDELFQPETVEARKSLADMASDSRPRRRGINAAYDAVQDSDEYAKYWSLADANDADAANSRGVRMKAIWRSRYEHGNNGYAAGIASTLATDLIGRGPRLRMETSSQAFNQMVEREWRAWAKEVKLRMQLWTLAHAKHVDGESFAMVRRNERLRHRVKLDLRLYEAEEIHTPYLPWGSEQHIDGIMFDEFDNPIYYDVLRNHPGSDRHVRFDFRPSRIPAKFMLHWFK